MGLKVVGREGGRKLQFSDPTDSCNIRQQN